MQFNEKSNRINYHLDGLRRLVPGIIVGSWESAKIPWRILLTELACSINFTE